MLSGIGAHTDYEVNTSEQTYKNPRKPTDIATTAPFLQCFTLLIQDKVAALQVLSPDGKWIEAPPIPGTLVCNLGDQLQRWTSGFLLDFPAFLHDLS